MKKIVPVVLIGLFLSFLAYRLYEEMSSSDTVAADSGGPAGWAFRSAMLVEATPPETYVFESTAETVGELQAWQQVSVMPRANGYLHTITVDRADVVQRGHLLAEIDDVHVAQQILRAQAAIDVARAGVTREQATLDSLMVQVRRIRNLHEQGLVSRQDLEDAEARLNTASAQLELSRAQVAQAEASLQELRVQQELTKVYSPMDGVVAERFVDPGALVSPSTVLVQLVDISRLKVVIPMPESALRNVRVGLATQVAIDAFSGQTVQGTVRRISPVIRPDTRSADVEVEIPNSSGQLRPGMFARVQISGGDSNRSLSVPRSALLTRGNQQGVFVLNGEQMAEFRTIHIGRMDGNRVEVLSGIDASDLVITSGAQNLNEGDTVRLTAQQLPEQSRPLPSGDARGTGGANR